MKEKKRALRRYKDYIKAKKQVNLLSVYNIEVVKPLGYYIKHNSLNCGNPKCSFCSNPRRNKKVSKHLTIQELKFFEKFDYDKKNNFGE